MSTISWRQQGSWRAPEQVAKIGGRVPEWQRLPADMLALRSRQSLQAMPG
ncbi:hypothetical protein BIWAKO_06517 [Bosea sp. BIWAKO-01]|nr:hypothetical protein BIWAKO_06517 [Bosea sp. BIWAKO-01]